MRNDLNCPTKIIAAPLICDDLCIDLPRSKVADAAQAVVNESFVVTKIQVRFCAVIQHVHFTMLIRRHGARVHIDIRIQFLNGNFETALLKQQAHCRGGHTFSYR